MTALLLSILRITPGSRVAVRPKPLRRLDVKVWRHLFPVLISIGRLVVGNLNRDRIKVLAHWAKECARQAKHQGPKGLILWLKTINVLVMGGLPGSKVKPGSREVSKVAVAVSSDGLPRIIPKQDRRAIRRGDLGTIRLWLTLSGSYRAINLVGSPKVSTITDPGVTISPPLARFFETFLKREFFPNLARVSGEKVTGLDLAQLKPKPLPLVTSCAGAWRVPFATFNRNVSALATAGPAAWCWVSGQWGGELLAYCQAIGSWETTQSWWRLIEDSSLYAAPCGKMESGRISFKTEPAGKIRAFAMVDFWTQCTLRPLHDLIFSILKEIPQDGTFNQLAPAKELLKKSRLTKETWWSLDLSAATDRFPLELQKLALGQMLGSQYASAWANLLVSRRYTMPAGIKPRRVRYAVGQPMGAYSSWAAFAITHHAFVQFAFRLSGGSGWFKDYALLGDDILIANHKVALKYRWLCAQVGVDISLAKSMASNQRSFEFAKRVFFRGEDVSGFPWKLWQVAQRDLAATLALAQRLAVGRRVTTLAGLIKALGGGMKASSRAYAGWRRLSKPVRALLVIMSHPQSQTFLSKPSWLDWLMDKGVVSQSASDPSRSTWVVPWMSGFREEYLNPALKFLEDERDAEFFPPDIELGPIQGKSIPGSSVKGVNSPMMTYYRDWRCGVFVPTKVETLISVNRTAKLKALDDSSEKTLATLNHLQKLSISLQARNVSSIFSTMMTRLETLISEIPAPASALFWAQKEDEERRSVSVLFALWERWRLRMHRSRSVVPTVPAMEAKARAAGVGFTTDFD